MTQLSQFPLAGPHAASASRFGLGRQSQARAHWLTQAAVELEGPGTRVLRADLEHLFGTAYSALSKLFAPLMPIALAEAPQWVQRYGPELLQLWPALRDHELLAAAPTLDAISLGGTKRRLHQDSEQLFRISHGFASFLRKLLAEAPSLKGQRLALVCENLDAADRLSLAALTHLLHRLPTRISLLASAESDWLQNCADPGRPWVWNLSGQDDSEHVGAAYREHASILQRLFALGTTEAVACPPGDEMPDDAGDALFGRGPDGVPTEADRRRRRRRYAALPAEARGALHAAALAAEPAEAGAAEVMLAPLAYHALNAGEHARGLADSLRLIDAGFGFSMNFELMLLCGEEALRACPEPGAYDVAIRLSRSLACQYLGDVEGSVQQLIGAHEDCRSSLLRAQICFYVGLTLAKKCADIESGLAWLGRGAGDIAPLREQGWQPALEFGWLCNATAFCLWKKGQSEQAAALVSQALDTIRPYEVPQIVNLRINLVNNFSVLFESGGDFAASLRTWESLESLNALIDGGRFSKSYHYRRGWLLLQSGDIAAAEAAYAASYAIAEEVNDAFHMDIISRALGYVCVLQDKHDEAMAWYELNVRLREELGDYANAARSMATCSLLAESAGQLESARARGSDALELTRTHGRDALALQIAAQLELIGARSPAQARAAGLENKALGFDRPKMKLTTPFAIGHMVGVAANSTMHHSLSPSGAA